MLPFMTSMMQSAGAVLPVTTWNQADKSAQVTLSADKLTATQSDAQEYGARSTASRSSGKLYFELINLGPNTEIGLLSGTGKLGDMYYDNSSVFAYANDTAVNFFQGGSNLGQAAKVPLNTVFGFAWDVTGGFFKIFVNGTVVIEISSYIPNKPMFIAYGGFSAGSGARIRTTAAQFTQSAPAGFTPWN